MTVKPGFVPFIFPLLQKGFVLEAEVGCSLRELLAERFGISAEYIENRIQTVFLDGKPVDDMDAAEDVPRRAEGRVVVKLFNLTVRELGPLFLERGIRIDAEDLKSLFGSRPEALEEGCVEAAIDGRKVEPAMIPSFSFASNRVYLEVRTA